MVNFIESMINRKDSLESFSKDELLLIESSVNILIHIYLSEVKRLLQVKKTYSPILKKAEIESEISEYQKDIDELKGLSTKLHKLTDKNI